MLCIKRLTLLEGSRQRSISSLAFAKWLFMLGNLSAFNVGSYVRNHPKSYLVPHILKTKPTNP